MKIFIIFLSILSFLAAESDKDIFVINYEWHAGIVVKVKDINSSLWEVEPIFKESKYIEVGWGDEDFYKSSDPSVWMTLKAGLLPTSSVVHLRAVSQHELNSFSQERVAKLTISEKGFSKLSLFIENSFAKEDDAFIVLSKGLYPNSLFYLSSKKYHIFNTCNVWTAEALQSAEVDIEPFTSITTDNLFSQIYESQKQRSPSSTLKHGD
ncbi:MAG: DUF2459 domain-containing protein [Campylobacterota bacterium]|nr:DUF2459 domain-containing protein [Campylobacterota bacterium]